MLILTRWWFAALLMGAILLAWAVTVAPPIAVVTVSASRPSAASALPHGFIGSVDWVIRRAARGTSSSDPSGNAALSGTSPAPVMTTIGGDSAAGLPVMDLPPAELHLTVTGVAGAPATIVVRVTQTRDTVAGVSIPLVLVIACIVLIGIPATTSRRRRSEPVVFPPTHEHY